MNYTVLWSRVAEQRLAAIWNSARSRQAVTDAANAIDRALRTDADRRGESRPDNTRVLFVPPLGVLYSVREQDCMVNVLKVWRFKKRRRGKQ